MKTLKKTLAALANAELYATEYKATTVKPVSITATGTCNESENYDGDNIFYLVSSSHADMPYEAWNSIRANYVSAWQREAYNNGYSTISVLYGDGSNSPSHVVYEVNKTYRF